MDHSGGGGPDGFYSISGVKFTTSRLVAERTVGKIFPGKKAAGYGSVFGDLEDIPDLPFGYGEAVEEGHMETLKRIVEEESVMYLSDLVFRRTSLGENPKRALNSLEKLKPLFPFNDKRWKMEVKETEKLLRVEMSR